MAFIDPRELLAFPPGDNSSDTFIRGIHWNLTTLQRWNYAYYSNGTFSNVSRCYVLLPPHPRTSSLSTWMTLLPDGTFVNGTSCYSAIDPIDTRAMVGLFFAVFFALVIVATFSNLRKHGRLFLPSEKRFRAVGRRWQWYWMIAVAACGIISSITGVDVDRYYLPELPIVLANFFWVLMLPFTMAMVWESARHWGSWQERQMIDPDPFILSQDDMRSKVEFFIPLVFYFLAWMNFFMIFPRAWTPIEKQRSSDQSMEVARPAATDLRFKMGAFFLFGSWLTVVLSLYHSIKHYRPQTRGRLPMKFLLTIPISLGMIAYEAASAFEFSISPLNLNANLAVMYGLGWTPIALIVIIYNISGYLEPNEDRELIRQRRVRGVEIDRELGITRKPRWRRPLQGSNMQLSVHDQIALHVEEVRQGRGTGRSAQNFMEMGNMADSPAEEVKRDDISVHPARFVSSSLSTGTTANNEPQCGVGRPGALDCSTAAHQRMDELHLQRDPLPGTHDRVSNLRASAGAQPEKIRSMLDV